MKGCLWIVELWLIAFFPLWWAGLTFITGGTFLKKKWGGLISKTVLGHNPYEILPNTKQLKTVSTVILQKIVWLRPKWHFPCSLLPPVLLPLRPIKENHLESPEPVKPGNVLAASCPGVGGRQLLSRASDSESGVREAYVSAGDRSYGPCQVQEFYLFLEHTLCVYLYWGNQLFLLTSRKEEPALAHVPGRGYTSQLAPLQAASCPSLS